MRVLLVEDDLILGDGLREGLTDAGFNVEWLRDGRAALTALETDPYLELVVLDLGLPKLDGLAVLEAARARGDARPVLVLTARDAVEDRVTGLNLGADDYLIKPFALAELVARLHTIARRAQGRAGNALRWRELLVDPVSGSATLAGAPLGLTTMETRILLLLLRQHPRYVTRARLEALLYGWDEGVESNTLDVHLSHLRKKLGGGIENMRGLGWRLA
ncbi:response regulator [Chitiniphilus purpureus]|uniref:Response regulator n=1 Tax=Chitiniphilus purpureus TaxID=2981137 RepID=A0ABY6DVP9_9NEIS|nr:response regulator [Chitiniphilus sp. CD1]UXY15928.1 response regulator [Chitiniphilus sp. CD1]